MAKSLNDCGLCELKKISKPSVAWCPECEEGLCSECMEHHNISKASRDHKAIPIETYLKMPRSSSKISQFCDNHHEKYHFFCKKHDTPCCRRCVIESHNACKELAALDDIVKNIKKSNALDEAEMKLNEVTENIRVIIENRNQNVNDLHEERRNIEKSISQTRQHINDRLDKLQDDLLNDLLAAEKIEDQNIRSTISTLEQHQIELKEFQATLETMKQCASNIQVFLAIKKIEASVAVKDIILQSLVKDDKVNYKSLAYKIDETLKRLLDDVEKFGEIKIETNQSIVTIIKHKNREAQMMLRPITLHSSIDNIVITKQRNIDVNSSEITGCLMFSDGRTAFSCDWESRILVYKANGKIHREIKLSNTSVDITCINDDTLAVSSLTDRCINIVNIKSKKVKDTIKTGNLIYSITYRNGELIYCTEQGIKTLNLSDKITREIVNIHLGFYNYITTYEDKLYVTKTSTVTCCSMDGHVIWEFKDERLLKCPRGITTDESGNVFVVCKASSTILVISPDGKHCKELLLNTEELHNPFSLYYEKERKQILVGNLTKSALVYNVAYT